MFLNSLYSDETQRKNISQGSSFLGETENRPCPRRLSDGTNITILNKKDGRRRVLPCWIVMIANRKLSSLRPHSQPTELWQNRELKTDLIKNGTNLTGVTLPSPPHPLSEKQPLGGQGVSDVTSTGVRREGVRSDGGGLKVSPV